MLGLGDAPACVQGSEEKREGAECSLSLQWNILSRTLQALSTSLPEVFAVVTRLGCNPGSLGAKETP